MESNEKHVRILEVQAERAKTYGSFKSNIALLRKIQRTMTFSKKSKANTLVKNMLSLKLARATQGKALGSDIKDSLLDFVSYADLLKSHYGVIVKFTPQPAQVIGNSFAVNKEFTTEDILNNVESFLALEGANFFTFGRGAKNGN